MTVPNKDMNCPACMILSSIALILIANCNRRAQLCGQIIFIHVNTTTHSSVLKIKVFHCVYPHTHINWLSYLFTLKEIVMGTQRPGMLPSVDPKQNYREGIINASKYWQKAC